MGLCALRFGTPGLSVLSGGAWCRRTVTGTPTVRSPRAGDRAAAGRWGTWGPRRCTSREAVERPAW